ncbi:MAG: HAD family hydrolase [Ancrocorticia sp.]|nr:HAD family hydrolase [Ancrocorticia sp.]
MHDSENFTAGVGSLPSALLFDMDGTLVDSEPYWSLAEERVLPGFGVPWTPQLGLTSIGVPLGVWTAGLFARYGCQGDPREASVQIEEEMVRIFAERGVMWRPGAVELMELAVRLNIPSAIVTATHSRIVEAIRVAAPPGALSIMVAGDMVREGKPSPEGYLRAASIAGVAPQRCVAFEDSETGVQAALASGAVTVWVPFLVDFSVPRGVKIVRSLRELNEDGLRQLLA